MRGRHGPEVIPQEQAVIVGVNIRPCARAGGGRKDRSAH